MNPFEHVVTASAVVIAGAFFVACGPTQRGPVLNGDWWNTPEDLPYIGTLRNQTHVTFNVFLKTEDEVVVEGSGSVSPYYSSDVLKHVGGDMRETVAFTWSVADERRVTWTLNETEIECHGEILDGGQFIDMTVAGCPPFAERTAEKTIRFERRR